MVTNLALFDAHPWLSFRLDMRRASHHFWMLLGEARSKCDHLSAFPLTPETRKNLHQLTLIRGALATTAIEGNTLTENEIRDHLSGKNPLPESRRYQAQEVQNIITACDEVLSWVEVGAIRPIDTQLVRHFQGLILNGLELDEGVVRGQFRQDQRVVGNYRPPLAREVEPLMIQLLEWINGEDFSPANDSDRLPFAILRAIVAHLYLEWIHPFADGNGRTGRMLEFYILLSSGVPSSAAHVLSNHYNATRDEYYRQLNRARETNPIEFILYALQGFVDGLRDQLEHLWKQAIHLLWRRYLDDVFAGDHSTSAPRCRELLIHLAQQDEPVEKTDLRHISPEVAEAYAQLTEKAMTRDVNSLVSRDLLRRSGNSYQANIEILYLTLPAQADRPRPPIH